MNATLYYAVELATRGVRDAVSADPEFALGVNTVGGAVTNATVAGAARPGKRSRSTRSSPHCEPGAYDQSPGRRDLHGHIRCLPGR